MYQSKVDVDMLNAIKSVLADVSSVSPLSEPKSFQRKYDMFKKEKVQSLL